jgi:hypothetical protein
MVQHLLSSEVEGEFEDVSGVVGDNQTAEDAINAELGSPDNGVEFNIKVYRVPDNGGKTLAWLFDQRGETVAGLSTKLRDEYGSGTYVARVYKNSKLHRVLQLAVELPKSRPSPIQATPNDSALATIIQQQGTLMQSMAAQLAEMRRAPVAPVAAIDPLAMFGQMAAMAKAMREMNGPPQPAADPLAMINSVVSLVKGLENEGREKGVIDLVSDALNSDLFKGVVNGMQQNAQPQQPQRALPAPTAPNVGVTVHKGAPPAPAQPVAEVPPQDDNAKAFNDLLALLVLKAAKNSDPVLYADFIEDSIAPEMLEQLLALPDPVAILAQYNPAIATYRAWFVEVIEALTAPPEGETTGGAPNSPAPGSNAVEQRAPAASADGSP